MKLPDSYAQYLKMKLSDSLSIHRAMNEFKRVERVNWLRDNLGWLTHNKLLNVKKGDQILYIGLDNEDFIYISNRGLKRYNSYLYRMLNEYERSTKKL